MMDAKLEALTNALASAQQEQKSYLRELFPMHSRVGVMLSCKQATPTPATVQGYDSSPYGGVVRVKIETAKPRSRQQYRSVSVNDVVLRDAGAA